MRISREELKKLLRQFPKIEDRYLFSSGFPECDDSYVDANLNACVWLLDHSDLILQALNNYGRIVSLAQEEVDE
jgi:hypothetical protein